MNSTSAPGPPGHFLVGNLPEFARDVLGFFTSCARTYGDVVRLRMGRRTALLISHPDAIAEILVGHHRDFVKHSFFWRHVTDIFGTGLLTAEGDAWLRQRRLMQPAFHRDRIAGYGEVMVRHTEQMLDGWADGESRDVHQELMGLTMRIVAKVLFDTEVAAEVDRVSGVFEAGLRQIAARFRRPVRIPEWLPVPGNLEYRRAVRVLDRLIYRIIDEHGARAGEGDDLLSMLMRVRDEDGTGLTRKQLRDEAVTLLLAGHETTALALSWTWYLLARHPEVEAELAAELASVAPDRPPGVADLASMPFTERVITESLRLYPPAYAIGREAVRDTEVAGIPVPAGTTLFISPWVVHRDARWYDDPERFDPHRWDGDAARRLPKYAYLPFGGGPRLCIGNRFAVMEATLLLATIARRFRFTTVDARAPVPFPTVTLRPRDGLPVVLSRRCA